MADTQFEIALKDLAADEMIPLVSPVPPRLLARLVKTMPGIDLQSEFSQEIMLVAILRPVPDPEAAERIAAERRERDELSAAAGRKIQQQLKEQGQIQ